MSHLKSRIRKCFLQNEFEIEKTSRYYGLGLKISDTFPKMRPVTFPIYISIWTVLTLIDVISMITLMSYQTAQTLEGSMAINHRTLIREQSFGALCMHLMM